MNVVFRSLLLIGLVACSDEAPYTGAFDVPTAIDWLPAEQGPFGEPVGYVASGHGGQIGLLALTRGNENTDDNIIGHGAFFADDGTTLLDRGGPIPTGAARSLTSIAVFSDGSAVDVFAGDAAFHTLVRAPHVLAANGSTLEQPKVTFTDGSGGRLAGLVVRDGYAASETWTIALDGEEWSVIGSRSGRQPNAVPGEAYETPGHALAFTISGTEGGPFTVAVDSGVEEIDVGGTPITMARSPDGAALVLVVTDPEGMSSVVPFDPATRTAGAPFPLPAGSDPVRLAFAEDGALFVADARLPSLWEIPVEGDLVEHPLPWPIADVAVLGDTAFVVPHADDTTLDRQVWRFDLVSDEALDTNAWRDGVQGLDLRGPISGLAAIEQPYERADWRSGDAGRSLRSVAVSLTSGRVVFVEEDDGCLVPDGFGPRSTSPSGSSQGDVDASFDDVANAAFLEPNPYDGRSVRVNPCPGVAGPETWRLMFDGNVQGWRVEGSVSGEQASIAWENQRYVSDDGAVSFLVRSGSTPSRAGWTMQFQVLEGALSADGDLDGDNQRGANEGQIDIPGPPMPFVEGDTPWIAVPSGGDDTVGRIDPRTGRMDLAWR